MRRHLKPANFIKNLTATHPTKTAARRFVAQHSVALPIGYSLLRCGGQ
ncbi:hypothetical protein QUB70_18105 [Microcoleus sp. A003_D6]